MKKWIILVDFSKVVSPIWISRFVASNLEKYLTIDKNEIRKIYKENIWKLVIAEYSIFQFIDNLEKYLIDWFSRKDLEKQIYKIPKVDKKFLEKLLLLKKDYHIVLISDVYKELGLELSKKLKRYFDEFVFSFEEWAKKSQKIFWERISRKINFEDVKLFIDDKKENIDLAREFWIKWFIYKNYENDISDIFWQVYPKYDSIILWAWAAGIIYSYLLQKTKNLNFLILEKDDVWMGLMSSFKIWYSYFDIWWHALHDNKKVLSFLEREKNIKLFKQKRKAYILYDWTFIPFPFQLHLKYLDPKKRRECLLWFMKSYINNKWKKTYNMDDYLKKKFWDGIYKHFLKDYNLKIWKTKLDRLSTNWQNRVYYESIDVFLEWYLNKNEENYWTNSYVYYPQEWWYENLLLPFFEDVKQNINYSIKIKYIDLEAKLISTNDWTFCYDKLVSTIPINELIKLTNINFDFKKFEYLSLQILAILTPKINTNKQRVYTKDKEYYFHKCVLNSNSSNYLKNKDEFIFQFESTYKNWKKIDKQKLIENAKDFLVQNWFISSRDDFFEVAYKDIKYWYPIQTNEMLKIKEKITKKLNKYNVVLIWRFWNWDYINFDKLIEKTITTFNLNENENIDI